MSHPMIRPVLGVALVLATAMPAGAQEETKTTTIGSDSYLAGQTVLFEETGKDDLFAAGEIVRARTDITGSAHLAGRKVTMSGAVGGDAYVAGVDVVLDGPVTGDATLTGYNVDVGAVSGNLRISGGNLVVKGPIKGYAVIGGESVRIDGPIAGDVVLTARDLTFAEGVTIGGKVTLFEEKPGTIDVPENIVPADRLERRDLSEWEATAKDLDLWDWQSILRRFLFGVILIGALATIIAAIIPQTLADMREGLLARRFRNLLFGFLTQSAFIGAAILLLMTIIGIIASPAAILAALIAGFAGYVVAVYAFGVGLLLLIGRPAPASIGMRALAAGVGAVVVGLLALIPFLGWLFVLILMLAGVGAITLKTLRPAFFVPA